MKYRLYSQNEDGKEFSQSYDKVKEALEKFQELIKNREIVEITLFDSDGWILMEYDCDGEITTFDKELLTAILEM